MRSRMVLPIVLVALVLGACRPAEPTRPAPSASLGATTSIIEPSATPDPDRADPSTAPEPERYEGMIEPIDAALRARLIGRNWHPGCPVAIRDLRLVEVAYRNLEGEVRRGPLVVHEDVANDVRWVFRQLFRARFAIHRIGLPPRFRPARPADRDSTRNLSSSFNCRPATGNPGSLSHHSYGWAIDINPLRNPYVRGDGTVLRPAVLPFVDRSRDAPGMIHDGDVVVRSFARIGWEWGGHWTTLKDYMHFSLTGR